MYFKKLELFGFKSFVDKTTIHFESGVTAIVGPNGCGKSNISDAIRWVLGEQSAKSLRGSNMEDVIFNGSALKEPVNLAEVSLTLSNESKVLAIDYDEVTISRRLYRSGESEYLINKNVVRLKDVHELLMGTGIGIDSYSIIEQGKMDAILNSKPEDRRTIFEEAAGITKFKAKKKEALRKLEQTESNLLRINDIIQEVKRQIGSIERQAKKAENYKVEFAKLKELELALASREFLMFENTRKSKEGDLHSLRAKEEENLAIVEAIESRYDEERQRLDQADEANRRNQEEEWSTNSDLRSKKEKALLNRERIGEFLAKRENLSKEIQSTKNRMEELAREFENLNREFESVQKEETDGLEFLNSVEGEFRGIEDSARQIQSEENELRTRISELASKKMRLQSETARCEAEFSVLESRIHRLRSEEEGFTKQDQDLDQRLHTALAEAKTETEQLNPELEVKIHDFRNKVREMLKRWRETASLSEVNFEAQLESEIRVFADELMRLQVAHTAKKEKFETIQQDKSRIANELLLLAGELAEIGTAKSKILEAKGVVEAEWQEILKAEEQVNNEIAAVQARAQAKVVEKEALLVRLAETRSRQQLCTSRREKIERDKNWILESRTNEENRAISFENEALETSTKKEALEAENISLEDELSDLTILRDEVLRRKEATRLEREEVLASIENMERERNEKREFLKTAQGKLHGFELENVQIQHEIDRLKERVFNSYQIDLVVECTMRHTESQSASELGAPAEFDAEKNKLDIQDQRERLNRMGPVNLVAIQEYDEMKVRFDFLSQQELDLLKAKDDLHKAIVKINRTTRELFADTFQKIQKNFTEYYKLLFGGGSAELVLLDENDVLESGIEIVARPPGKKLQNISLLSGGEKALTAVALLFSIFKVKPGPFCVLDEIDAPLDESNVDRFCTVLKEFIVQSQFILITHNKRTMNLADAMYGITMAQTGVSRVVSVRFSEKVKENHAQDNAEVLV